MILVHFEGKIVACFSLFYSESVVFGAPVLLKNNKKFRIQKNYSKAFQTYFYDLLGIFVYPPKNGADSDFQKGLIFSLNPWVPRSI